MFTHRTLNKHFFLFNLVVNTINTKCNVRYINAIHGKIINNKVIYLRI